MEENLKISDSADISVRLGRLHLKNPVMIASGTSGSGEEYSRFIDLNQFGGIIVKGTSLHPKLGNPPARVYETAGGMLSSIGLQNVGVERFIKEKLPFLKNLDTTVIVSIFGNSTEEYEGGSKRLDGAVLHYVRCFLEFRLSSPNRLPESI